MENRRKYRRFVLPLVMEFRPTYGAKEFSPALIKNVSFQGVMIEALFNFIQYENVDIRVFSPEYPEPVLLNGEVQWKRDSGDVVVAGIQYRKDDKSLIKVAEFLSPYAITSERAGSIHQDSSLRRPSLNLQEAR